MGAQPRKHEMFALVPRGANLPSSDEIIGYIPTTHYRRRLKKGCGKTGEEILVQNTTGRRFESRGGVGEVKPDEIIGCDFFKTGRFEFPDP